MEISGANAKKIPIPIAPLERQHEIVAEIEKQFSRLDEAAANLKRYAAAVLKAAVEGRLVPAEAAPASREGGERWRDVLVGDVAQVISGLTKNPKRQTYPRKLPYLRVANVYANELRLDDIQHIGVAGSEIEKLLLRPGGPVGG